jgi:hypothetical protein
VAKAVDEVFGDRMKLAGPGSLSNIWVVQV